MQNKVISGLIWKFSERILAQGLMLVVGIILARLLSPEDYGSISLVMVFVSIADIFINYSFSNALIQKREADNLDFSSVFFFNIIFSFVVYGGLFWAAPWVEVFYDINGLSAVIRILGIKIIISAVNSVQQAYVSKNMLFRKFFFSTLGGTVASAIIGILMAFQGYGVWALVFQYLINSIVDTSVLWFTVKWRPQVAFSMKRMKILFKFGWKLLISGIIDRVYIELRSLIIGKMYQPSELAYYKNGQKYPELIVNNINASISAVFFPAVSLEQNNIEKVKSMTRRAIQISSYVIFPCMVGMAVCANELIKILLTDKWLPCVPYLRIACFTFAFYPIHTANLDAIKALGRSDLFLKLEIIKKGIGLIMLAVTIKYGAYAMALGMMPTALTSSFINARPNKKLLGYGYKEQLKDIIPNFVISAVMGVAVWAIGKIILNSYMLLFLQIFSGVLIYILLSIFSKNSSFRYLSDFIHNYFVSKSS